LLASPKLSEGDLTCSPSSSARQFDANREWKILRSS